MTTTMLSQNRKALNHATWNLYKVIAVASLVLNVLVIWNPSLTKAITGEAAPKQLVVQDVGFDPTVGKIYQMVAPARASVNQIEARFAGSIVSSRGFPACGGTSQTKEFARTLTPVFYDPSEWVGEPCHLEVGETYTARGRWSWQQGDGSVSTASTMFRFTYEITPEVKKE